uniref:Ig-like domain-containing protein n=1 Tax=Monopterus albus TaxID=43700 RepID=A0A3Q3PZA5_MONAL
LLVFPHLIFTLRLWSSLSLCVSSTGTCVVKVAQSSYQAEEDGDVTLEWTFTTTAHSSSDSLFIFCSLLTVHKELVLFRLHEGVEVPESQDKQFSGRVQWDTDVLREGRLRLHVSRLRTEDSGVYLCEVSTGNSALTAVTSASQVSRLSETFLFDQ